MYQGEYIELKDFSGGLVVPAIFGSSYANAGVNLALNQASDLDNIYILPTGTGFRSRPGKTIINTSSALDGPVVGLHYLLEADLDDYTFAVAGTKIYRASTSDFSSLADITGAVVITSDETNYWDLLTFDDAVIGFGGPSSAPEAPWRATNSGNAAALGGSPPSAAGAFTVNNRVFAFRTAANPSIIYWSIIGNAEDWTGTGSGNTTVGSLDDNDRITGVLPVDTNSAFIFKQNSIYRMILNEAPFPVYLVASGDAVGATGKKALINIDSTMFWLAPDCKSLAASLKTLSTWARTRSLAAAGFRLVSADTATPISCSLFGRGFFGNSALMASFVAVSFAASFPSGPSSKGWRYFSRATDSTASAVP